MVLSKLYVKSVYLNLFGWRWGAKFMKKFKGVQGIKVWEPLG
jgi:hypothetical protein